MLKTISKYLYVLLIILVFVKLFSFPLLAKEKTISDKISLEADNIEYVPTDNLFASGNVKIQYKGYNIESDYFQFIKEKRELEFYNHFKLQKDDFLITADRVFYNIENRTGSVDNAHAVINKFIINGKNISLLSDKIEITDASLTTCTQNIPHYSIKSSSIQLFPQSGGAIAYNNWLYLGTTPVFYFPTFIFASKIFTKGEDQSSSPIPEFGMNQLDGWFVKENLGFFTFGPNPGSVNFGYTEKGHLFIGAAQNLALSPYDALQIKAQLSQLMPFKGGIYYYLDFSKRSNAESNDSLFIDSFISNFLPNTNAPINNLTIKYAYREFINNYWLDSTPFLGIDVNNLDFNLEELKLSTNFTMGYLAEYDNNYNKKSSIKVNLNSNIKRTFSLNNNFYLTPSVAYFGNFYTIRDWQRLFLNFELAYTRTDWALKPAILGSIQLINTGESPFKFDSTNIQDDSEIGFKLASNTEPYEFSLETNYKINKHVLRNLDFKGKLLMHCWKLILGYNVVQGQFIISAELN